MTTELRAVTTTLGIRTRQHRDNLSCRKLGEAHAAAVDLDSESCTNRVSTHYPEVESCKIELSTRQIVEEQI